MHNLPDTWHTQIAKFIINSDDDREDIMLEKAMTD